MNKIRIKLYDLLTCMSNAQDLISTKLSNHHQQVAYLSYWLAEEMKLPENEQKDLFLAALIHDMGALSIREKLEIIESEPINVNSHAFRGAKLFEEFWPLKRAAGIIKYHHLPWNNGEGRFYMGEEVPFASHIIHLADRACAMIRPETNILSQIPGIVAAISKQADTHFHPDLVAALVALSKKEYIWLDLTSRYSSSIVAGTGLFDIHTLEIDDLVDLALVFSYIIDFRSPFTARHSAGVARTAETLARRCGFSPYECKMMLIAGYLHDLGKIAIGDEILEKPAKLNEDEFNVIRAHTYYTYHLLAPLEQLETINAWASFHHEKLNGTGYPFHIAGENLSLGSRIMAVADVFTAITENRPYRTGMNFESTKNVLMNMVAGNALDANIVSIVIDNFVEINMIRENSQIAAEEHYKNFLLSAGSGDATSV